MAKLHFSYAAMNAGKSTVLLPASYNYLERGMRTMLLTSALTPKRRGLDRFVLGIEAEAQIFLSGSPDVERFTGKDQVFPTVPWKGDECGLHQHRAIIGI